MELDDMKLAWRALDRQLDKRYALDLANFRDRKLVTARARLRPLVIGQVLQIIAGTALIVMFAGFWSHHLDSPHLLISGVLLHAYSVLLIISAGRELGVIHSIDYAAPVVTIQRKLAELRAWRLRMAPVFAIIGCFIWIPLVLVAFKAWFNADIYRHAPEVVLIFIACGTACLAVLLAFNRWVRRPGRENIAKHIDGSSVGKSLTRVQAVLDEVARFETE